MNGSDTELERREGLLREELIGAGSPDTWEKNYLIEAGAGAGKTHIMVSRIVNQLASGRALPDQLAAITFTEKAAQEMQERIDAELLKRLKAAGEQYGTGSSEAGHLQVLLDGIDRMQISTIHSFCSRLLTTMPYESQLGPEFEVREDIEQFAEKFFDRMVLRQPERFAEAKAATGITYGDLRQNFLRLCESGAELPFEDPQGEACAEWQKALRETARLLSVRIAEGAAPEHVKNPQKGRALELLPQMNQVLELKKQPERLAEALIDTANPLKQKYEKLDPEAYIRLLPGTIKENKARVQKDGLDPMTDCWRKLIHAWAFSVLVPLIREYRQEKLRQHLASQNDLVLYARDLLRDSREAREYFHRRYRTIYVDEMQDTDPVQAQLLFCLTADPERYDPADWRRCRPVPGSLFLVGDPKQAIYRFRGADISVYKTLMDLFRSGAGTVETLHFNYRSAAEVCAFADAVFGGRLGGGQYQAEYSSMHAVHGSAPEARILSYEAGEADDAERQAAFIEALVSSGAPVGMGKDRHPARYSDFMILTRINASAERYVKALADRGIPSSMSGARKFSEVPPIHRAGLILQWLKDPEDETALASVLYRCYGIDPKLLRTWRQRAGRLTAAGESVRRALCAEPEGAPLSGLAAALEELSSLLQLSRREPAGVLLDSLFFRTAGVWEPGACLERSKDYAMVCQYLKQLEESRDRGFSGMVDDALALTESEAHRELLLEAQENCVRIMNLHKAKGLEAEVILLAFDSPFKASPEQHAVYSGGRQLLYSCLTRKGAYGGATVLGSGLNWSEAWEPEEHAFLEAEIDRLLYVAATRAKTALILCGTEKKAWSVLGEACGDPELCAAAGIRTADEADPDPAWQSAIDLLRGPLPEPADAPGLSEEAVPSVSSAALDAGAAARAAGLAGQKYFEITPSRLEEDRQESVQQLLLKEEPSGIPEAAPAGEGSEPHGTVWGTLMHRVLELAVRTGCYDPEGLSRLAQRAVGETLSSVMLTEEQEQLLTGGRALPDESALAEYLQQKAAAAAAFLCDPAGALRQLIDGADCSPELPFLLLERETGGSLQALTAAKFPEAAGRPLELSGIIDLAVHRNGAWTVVDYKTDSLQPGESRQDYIRRLKQLYTPQLRAYAEVLSRLGSGTVERSCICAVRLGGALIDLEP